MTYMRNISHKFTTIIETIDTVSELYLIDTELDTILKENLKEFSIEFTINILVLL